MDQYPINPISYYGSPMEVQAEGLDYSTSTSTGNMPETVPSAFNFPELEKSIDKLLSDDDADTQGRSIPSTPGSSREHNPLSAARSHHKPIKSFVARSIPSLMPSSSSASTPRSRLVDEIYQDSPKRHHRSKKSSIRKMRHSYDKLQQPSKGRIAKCACDACWAENIGLISGGRVVPSSPSAFSPSRAADKCQKIRSTAEVSFSNSQKTLQYDVNTGKVFECVSERPNFNAEHRPLGAMVTWGGSDEEEIYDEDAEETDEEEIMEEAGRSDDEQQPDDSETEQVAGAEGMVDEHQPEDPQLGYDEMEEQEEYPSIHSISF